MNPEEGLGGDAPFFMTLLIDDVLDDVPVRQWVWTLPWARRMRAEHKRPFNVRIPRTQRNHYGRFVL